MSPDLAHRVIPLLCGIWSLSAQIAAQATDAADTEKPTWQYRYRISALPTMADIDHPRIDVRFVPATRHFHCSTRKFSQSHGRPVTMTAVPVQPFSRSPGGSGGRAAAGGDVGS